MHLSAKDIMRFLYFSFISNPGLILCAGECWSGAGGCNVFNSLLV